MTEDPTNNLRGVPARAMCPLSLEALSGNMTTVHVLKFTYDMWLTIPCRRLATR